MADVFISYSKTDEALAQHVHQHLVMEGVTAFLASLSLQPGTAWEPAIRMELQRSPWVVFLASQAACSSPIVQQEMGGAWLAGKQVTLLRSHFRECCHIATGSIVTIRPP